ncbi:larval cuticle protein 1-like [Pectinophora gossypiella]|uniref:larval cuticle protein 1-like n=1 Tax=Pectinophora gossypiella TaxID=13191 RepID=UPI00214F5A5D|nr:larval cuticle protein 1-like [Pectinophora gossypiella]
MKVVIVALALVGLAAAASVSDEAAQIIRSEFEQTAGGYVYSYETDNGLSRQETGEVKQALDEENKPHDVVVVRGSYSYTDPEGKPQTITYVADETGFHAEGDSIPKEPVSRR